MHAPARCVVIDDRSDLLALELKIVRTVRPSLDLVAFDSSIDALDFLRANPVDLILTDFQMPFVDGLRLIAAVRLVDRHVRIIMMSGQHLESAALAAGANAFVLKPALLRDLGAILESLGFAGPVTKSTTLRGQGCAADDASACEFS
jgi:CheY-like chemotaxis protein